MEFTDKDIKRMSVLLLVLVLAILVFLLVKPILMSIIWGLILAYAFFPIYNVILKTTRYRNLAATLVCILVIVLIVIPLYYFTPILITQFYELFDLIQGFEIKSLVTLLFPSAPDVFVVQLTGILSSTITKISAAVLKNLTDVLFELPSMLFHFAIVAFVFFFALRDSDKLYEFASTLSPLSKIQEAKLVKQFKDITNSIIYGQILIGIAQGVVAGLGFFLFDVPNALILTVMAVILSIIPVLGPFIIWGPVAIYILASGNTPVAITYILYNLLIVSNIDNLLRIYLVSRKTDLSQAIVLIGMIGGLFFFGILGLIIGPLLLAYFITFLNAYRENTMSSLFKGD